MVSDKGAFLLLRCRVQIAHLEKMRTIRLNWAAAVFQKNWRCIVVGRWYIATRKKVIRAQARTPPINFHPHISSDRNEGLVSSLHPEARTFLAKLQKKRLKQNKAATVLQKYGRAWLGRRHYRATIQAAVLFQSSTEIALCE